ncbi:unnamed protein product, partial [Nesidiocoris tenuis]
MKGMWAEPATPAPSDSHYPSLRYRIAKEVATTPLMPRTATTFMANLIEAINRSNHTDRHHVPPLRATATCHLRRRAGSCTARTLPPLRISPGR